MWSTSGSVCSRPQRRGWSSNARPTNKRVAEIQAAWRDALGKDSANSTVDALIKALSGVPVTTVPQRCGAHPPERTSGQQGDPAPDRRRCINAMTSGRRKCAFEAADLINALAQAGAGGPCQTAPTPDGEHVARSGSVGMPGQDRERSRLRSPRAVPDRDRAPLFVTSVAHAIVNAPCDAGSHSGESSATFGTITWELYMARRG